MINIEDFVSNLLKIDKSYKNLFIYYTEYVTTRKIDDYESIQSGIPLNLIIGRVDGHIEEKSVIKYLVFDSTDENKEVLKKQTETWDEIKNETDTINGVKDGEYGKSFIKIKFDADNYYH